MKNFLGSKKRRVPNNGGLKDDCALHSGCKSAGSF